MSEQTTALEIDIDRALAVIPKDREAAYNLFDEAELNKLAIMLDEATSIQSAALLAGNALAAVTTDESEAALVALVGRAYKVEQEVERLRVARVQPLNNEVRSVNELLKRAFGQLAARFGGNGSEAARVLNAYKRARAARQQRERDEADRKMREAAEAEGAALRQAEEAKNEQERQAALSRAEEASRAQMVAEVLAPAPVPHKGVKTDDGKVSYGDTWTYEIDNPELVPRQYLMPDEKKIAAAVKAGVRDIPGCNIHEADTLRRGV